MGTEEIPVQFVRQDVPGLRRRQFKSERFAISVWQNTNGDVEHFRMLVAPGRIIDFEGGRGMKTGHATVEPFTAGGEWKEAEADMVQLSAIKPDKFIDIGTVKEAFQLLQANPPASQKRTVRFVAHVLFQALTSPHGLLKFEKGKLPAGADSVLGGSDADNAAIRDAFENKNQLKVAFDKLMAFLGTGD